MICYDDSYRKSSTSCSYKDHPHYKRCEESLDLEVLRSLMRLKSCSREIWQGLGRPRGAPFVHVMEMVFIEKGKL